MDNKIKERLLKMYHLAIGGVDGERHNAQKLLEANLKKYGLTIEDLTADSEEIKTVCFRATNEYLRMLLVQIVGVVSNTNQVSYSKVKREGTYFFKLTKSQGIEAKMMFDFYKELWEKELTKFKGRLFQAFISKHHISLSSQETEGMTEEQYREAMLIAHTMEGLDDAVYRKQLQSGDESSENRMLKS